MVVTVDLYSASFSGKLAKAIQRFELLSAAAKFSLSASLRRRREVDPRISIILHLCILSILPFIRGSTYGSLHRIPMSPRAIVNDSYGIMCGIIMFGVCRAAAALQHPRVPQLNTLITHSRDNSSNVPMTVVTRGFFHPRRLHTFRQWMMNYNWPIRFQLEALLRSGLSHTDDPLAISGPVSTLVLAGGTEFAADSKLRCKANGERPSNSVSGPLSGRSEET